jgi:DNA-directed RNA polymerase subunit RPC12/RpoP
MTELKFTRRRGPLALVVAPEPDRDLAPTASFCSHCGARPEAQQESRVCQGCGFGVLLEARVDVAPAAGDAFMVLDASLSVCALSSGAEQLLAMRETDAVNRHVTELVVPADAEAQGAQNLAVAVTWAARGDDRPSSVTVRPANTFGVRLGARIASCGPPTAALVVFDT